MKGLRTSAADTAAYRDELAGKDDGSNITAAPAPPRISNDAADWVSVGAGAGRVKEEGRDGAELVEC